MKSEKGAGENGLIMDKEVDQQLSLGTPIDFSFRSLTTLDNFTNERPRALRVGRTPKRGPKRKYLTRSIWLNNNNLENTGNLEKFVEEYLEVPGELGWLDLSFNLLTDIDSSLSKYDKLKILYLHGNKIDSFDKLKKLTNLRNLRSLTLHGNPIEAFPNYRAYIVHNFPRLVNLDFSPVVPSERVAVYSPVRG